jgi:hypothetical protein
MNWTRGLLRVWLLLSVLWVLGVAFTTDVPKAIPIILSTQPQRSDLTAADIDVIIPEPGLLEARYGGQTMQVRTGGVTPDMTEQWGAMLSVVAKEMNKKAALLSAKERVQENRLGWAAFLAISVPLGGLLLGLAFVWAARGFRKSSG